MNKHVEAHVKLSIVTPQKCVEAHVKLSIVIPQKCKWQHFDDPFLSDEPITVLIECSDLGVTGFNSLNYEL